MTETNSTISFDVGRLGSPVLVKVPYFPNWHATGALGPFEVSPNLMAVVPTAHHVTLTYGTTMADQLGKLASLGGVVGLGMLMTLRTPVMSRPQRAPTPAPLPNEDREAEVGPPVRTEEKDDEDEADLVTTSPEPGPEFPHFACPSPNRNTLRSAWASRKRQPSHPR